MKYKLYDFTCKTCQHEWEELVDIKEYEADPNCICCPDCGVCEPEQQLAQPKHRRHGSWSRWRI